MIATYPEAEDTAIDPQAERIMESVIEIVRSIRNVRAQYKERRDILGVRFIRNIQPVEAIIYADELLTAIAPYTQTIQKLARAKKVAMLDRRKKSEAPDNALALVLKESEVIITFHPTESVVDLETERKRLQKEIEQSQAGVARLEARLNDKAFLTRAPAAIVDKERDKLAERKDKLERLKQQLSKFQP